MTCALTCAYVGLGDEGKEWNRLAEKTGVPWAKFVFPSAPMQECTISGVVAGCCSVLQCRSSFPVPLCRSALFRVLQCVAVCCSVLQCVAVCPYAGVHDFRCCCRVLQGVTQCCWVLLCAAVCCRLLQCYVDRYMETQRERLCNRERDSDRERDRDRKRTETKRERERENQRESE